jgi:hypothetical protein
MRTPRQLRNDRPIDRFRNSAGHFEVAGDAGTVIRMFTLRDERIYFIRENGVSSAQMADQIDPDRKNPNIPQVVQRSEIHYGATASFIQRTICTCVELFNKAHLPHNINADDAIIIAINAADSLANIQDNISLLQESEARVRQGLAAGNILLDILPTTNGLKQNVESSISSMRKVAILSQSICDLFYPRIPKSETFSTHLRGKLIAQLGNQYPGQNMVDRNIKILETIFDYRNALVHEDDSKSLTIYDYEIDQSGSLVAPTLEIKHRSSPQSRVDAREFLSHWLDAISIAFETYVAFLCDRNVTQSIEGLQSYISDDADIKKSGTRFQWNSVWLEGYPKIAG